MVWICLSILGIFCLGVWTYFYAYNMLYRLKKRIEALIEHRDELLKSLARAREVSALDQMFFLRSILLVNEPNTLMLYDGPSSCACLNKDNDITLLETWVDEKDQSKLRQHIHNLYSLKHGFSLEVRTKNSWNVMVKGHHHSGKSYLCVFPGFPMNGQEHFLNDQVELLSFQRSVLTVLLNAIPQPVWRRDKNGQLLWVNTAYAQALEATQRKTIYEKQVELIDTATLDQLRSKLVQTSDDETHVIERCSAVVSGKLRILDVIEKKDHFGFSGIALDVTEQVHLKQDIFRQKQANAHILDQIPTAVAIFDARKRLIFYNAAYRHLWGLEPAFLNAFPFDGEILEELRRRRQLPEQADFKLWKANLLEAYQAEESNEHWWHLPDGRTLRLLANPNPEGGLTYLFEDLSENMRLESKYNTLIKVQAETLDTLKESVAVFGADGRLAFANRAFISVWELDQNIQTTHPHIDTLTQACLPLCPDENLWHTLRGAISAIELRATIALRITLKEAYYYDCTIQPLPEGATLLSLIDVTASVNVEKALIEKNIALEKASKLRDAFVHHVSYQLRSPLTNIIGFIELLRDRTVGDLNHKQNEYSEHILKSSTALLVIINDILDFASIDSGSLELNCESFDLLQAINATLRGLEDRIEESLINLVVEVQNDLGLFYADEKRIRQILFNLISNALSYSDRGATIRIKVYTTHDTLVLAVIDYGNRVTEYRKQRSFEENDLAARGQTALGANLGLSIVRSFVELHGGRVELNTRPNYETEVACLFPLSKVETNAFA